MNPVECCGEFHERYFCPNCGQKLREQVRIDEVITHFVLQAKKRRGEFESWLRRREKGERPQYCTERADSALLAIEKYERWIECLREARSKVEA